MKYNLDIQKGGPLTERGDCALVFFDKESHIE